jgi:4-hydroxybenzoate polyprenyltransferase
MDERPPRSSARALLLACHPGPALAVTLLGMLLGVAAEAGPRTVALIGAALLAGQLSIGWSNDAIDAGRDTDAGRRDKPVAQHRVSRRAVALAAGAAAVATVPLSLALGVWSGATHLLCVASAWSYNLGIKSTAWSWVPFAFSFGLLPAVVTFALPGHPWPAWWVMVSGALLGVGAHLVNVLPDLEQDGATGVRGSAHRLGGVATAVLAPVVLFSAVVVVVLGRPAGPGAAEWTAVVVSAGLCAAASWAGLSGRRLPALFATVAIALLVVAVLLASGSLLVA